jgi:hypothetical protein
VVILNFGSNHKNNRRKLWTITAENCENFNSQNRSPKVALFLAGTAENMPYFWPNTFDGQIPSKMGYYRRK